MLAKIITAALQNEAEFSVDRVVPLVFPTMVHADVVIGLTCTLGMSCDAGVIVIAT